MLQFDHCVSKSLRSVLLAAASMLATSAAWAAEEPRFEVTPLFGYHAGGQFKDGITDNTVKLNGTGTAAVAINWRASEPGTQYELFYSRQSTDTDEVVPTKLKVEYLHVGGTTIVGDAESRVVPFAVGGIGATRFSPSPSSMSQETRWSFNLGGGVRVPLAKHVRLRFEARGYLTWLGGDASLFCDSGCTLVAKSKTFFQYAALGGVSVNF
jgi:Outer membrane protein beta-barrel domain